MQGNSVPSRGVCEGFPRFCVDPGINKFINAASLGSLHAGGEGLMFGPPMYPFNVISHQAQHLPHWLGALWEPGTGHVAFQPQQPCRRAGTHFTGQGLQTLRLTGVSPFTSHLPT